MPAWAMPLLGFVGAALAGFLLAFMIATKAARERSREILREAENNRQLAEREIESRRKEAVLEARAEALQIKQEADREVGQKRQELARIEDRLASKEEAIDRRSETLTLAEERLLRTREELNHKSMRLDEKLREYEDKLSSTAQFTREEAREEMLRLARAENEQALARMLRDMEEQANREAEKRARNIVSLAISRCAVDQAAESTVSVVPLPSDEMKGRIIGREGRNIRSFETLTGVDVIIDDTPEAVVLSAFDPVRREVARLALTDLIQDGRIHPARIEESIEKAQSQVDSEMLQAAEHALMDAGVAGVSSEIVKLLGRLKFRTSYGQNCLKHSIEVAHFAGVMASELKTDVATARRAGLLHDIGKAVDMNVEGAHATIGADLLRKAGEPEAVIHAVSAHHNDEEPHSVEAVLVQAADAISASRPGARRESLETYVKRLQKLETIAESFDGVERTYAIQAGREVRIMVKPEEVNDETAVALARDTANRIEKEMEFPGQIKVTVIRETRAVEFAR